MRVPTVVTKELLLYAITSKTNVMKSRTANYSTAVLFQFAELGISYVHEDLMLCSGDFSVEPGSNSLERSAKLKGELNKAFPIKL
jgi:hypothetical protein